MLEKKEIKKILLNIEKKYLNKRNTKIIRNELRQELIKTFNIPSNKITVCTMLYTKKWYIQILYYIVLCLGIRKWIFKKSFLKQIYVESSYIPLCQTLK